MKKFIAAAALILIASVLSSGCSKKSDKIVLKLVTCSKSRIRFISAWSTWRKLVEGALRWKGDHRDIPSGQLGNERTMIER